MPRPSRRNVLTSAGGAALAALYAPALKAQAAWPDRPIRMLVPAPGGGPTDIVARLVAEPLARALGQPIVIDNRGGGAGNIATAALATAEPDGYTWMMGFIANSVNPAMFASLPFDTERDLIQVSQASRLPTVLVVHPSQPWTSVADILAAARARPGAIDYATGGIGTSSHLAGELLKLRAGIDLNPVHFRGGGPAMIDVIGGRVPILFDNPQQTLPHVQTGRLKALAVTTRERLAVLPQLPTMIEAGVPDFEVISWHGVLGRAGTPAAIVERMGAEIGKVLKTGEMQERFAALGMEAVGSTPAEFTAFFRAEMRKWAEVVRAANIRPE
jgi:tripartite-type tricarboxylate transporter receptor subunit TctC